MRSIAEPFVVAAPTGARIRTRLRVSERDGRVLRQVGAHLGRLAGADLAARCALGKGGKDGGVARYAQRTERKQALTAVSSSRWAGAITRTSDDQWVRAYNNLWNQRRDLRAAIATIRRRLDAPVGGTDGKVRGYATRAERAAKQQRLQVLEARLVDVDARIEAGRVSVTRGGRDLARTRHHLEAAGLTEAQWCRRWEAKRWFLTADGEKGKAWGNETIRVHPEAGWVELRLPTPLAGLSNTPRRGLTYRLDATATFAHRADQWAAQAANGAVCYTLWYDPDKGRWYIDASWTAPPAGVERDLQVLRGRRSVGVDLNDGHLACWTLDAHGNPVGPAHTIPLALDGSTARRDGQLRAAISALLRYARANGAASITIENLDFADARATGRETMGRGRRGRRFRRTVAGIPTAKFRVRLAAMAANAGIAIIAVDPAYTSKWGSQHWRKQLHRSHRRNRAPKVTRHHAAAVVIARRGLGHRARRRTEKPATRQRTGTGNHRPGRTRHPHPRGTPNPARTGRRAPVRVTRTRPNRTRPGATSQPNTVRGQPPCRTHSCTVSRNG